MNLSFVKLSSVQRVVKQDSESEKDKVSLNKWFTVKTEQGVTLKGLMLKKKVEEFAEKKDRNNFNAAVEVGLAGGKVRHNIKFKNCHEEKDSADLLEAE